MIHEPRQGGSNESSRFIWLITSEGSNAAISVSDNVNSAGPPTVGINGGEYTVSDLLALQVQISQALSLLHREGLL
jgi:hypothetical protein